MYSRRKSVKTSYQLLKSIEYLAIGRNVNVGYCTRNISSIYFAKNGHGRSDRLKQNYKQEESPSTIGRRQTESIHSADGRTNRRNLNLGSILERVESKRPKVIMPTLSQVSHNLFQNDIGVLLEKSEKKEKQFDSSLDKELSKKDQSTKQKNLKKLASEKYDLDQSGVLDIYESRLIDYLFEAASKPNLELRRGVTQQRHVLHYYKYLFIHALTELPREPECLTKEAIDEYVSSLIQYDFGDYSGANSLVSKILALLVSGKKHVYLTIQSYNLIIAHFLQRRQYKEAHEVLTLMTSRGTSPNTETLDHILRSYHSMKIDDDPRRTGLAELILELIREHNILPGETTFYLIYLSIDSTPYRDTLFKKMKDLGFKFLNVVNAISCDLALNRFREILATTDINYLRQDKSLLNVVGMELLIHIKRELYSDRDCSSAANFRCYEIPIFNGIITAMLKLDLVEEAASFFQYTGFRPNHSLISRFIVYFTKKQQLWYALATLNYFLANHRAPNMSLKTSSMIQSTINPMYVSLRDLPPFPRKFTVARICYQIHTLTVKKNYSPLQTKHIKEAYELSDADIRDFSLNMLQVGSKKYTELALKHEYKTSNELRYRYSYSIDAPELDLDESQFKEEVFNRISFLGNSEVDNIEEFRLTQKEKSFREEKLQELFSIGKYKRSELTEYLSYDWYVRSFIDLNKINEDYEFREQAKQLGYVAEEVHM